LFSVLVGLVDHDDRVLFTAELDGFKELVELAIGALLVNLDSVCVLLGFPPPLSVPTLLFTDGISFVEETTIA
jgi:hypothetical protein